MKLLTLRNIVFAILSLAIGTVFLFSAYAKIPTLDQFGWTIVETTFLNWTGAEWVARILIGMEFFLGLLFVSFFRIRRLAVPLSLITLVVFSFYLVLVLIQHGNSGNCGCFGEVIQMTPLDSLLKNAVLMLAISILYAVKNEWRTRYDRWILLSLAVICLLFPFFMNPPESIYLYEKPKDLNQPIPLSLLYHSSEYAAPKEELRKGKHIIAFMSLTCEHCRKAAKRIRIMKEKHNEIPFYFVLNGDTSNIHVFFEDTKATNIPYTHFNGVGQFIAMAGNKGLPSIKWIQDTTEVRETNYIILDDREILDWLK